MTMASDDDGLLGFLKDEVPDLAMAVGDSFTGGAVSRIAGALGMETSDPRELKRALMGNPELLQQLKRQERRLAFQELRAKLEDRQSARRMAIERQDADVDRLAYVILGGFFVLTVAVVTVAIVPNISVSAEVLSVAATLIGMASQKASQVVSFYFGSSTGSKKKDGVLAHQIEALGRGTASVPDVVRSSTPATPRSG